MPKTTLEELLNNLETDKEFQNLDETSKELFYKKISQLNSQKVNILLTGATGVGKSSTINALFGSQKAKVGISSEPETMNMQKYEFNNVILYDSPGLGDGKQKDIEHAKKIIDLLHKKDENGDLVIDLVLVILDGASRDYGTAYQLINTVIIPALGDDTSRLLIAINKADIAMSGRGWDFENNKPKENLVKFLDEKVESTKKRIKEATEVDVDVIYYTAGYKEEGEEQYPYNLTKLLAFILKHTKKEKRFLYQKDINKKAKPWEYDEDVKKHQDDIKKDFIDSAIDALEEAVKDIPGGKVVVAVAKVAKKVFDTVRSWLPW